MNHFSRKGSATFLSENISTIIILRDVLTKEATKRKMKLDVFCGNFIFKNHLEFFNNFRCKVFLKIQYFSLK